MTFEHFISLWGNRATLARAIGESEITVRHWFRRGSIPAWHDRKIIEAAAELGRVITHEDMFALRENISKKKEKVA